MEIYNSLSRKLDSLGTGDGKEPNLMYVCGLTPYDQTHIGHARTCAAFDTVKRYLKLRGHTVFHIQNITDVEDKIINRCKQTGADPKKLTTEVHEDALRLFDKLSIIRADEYPKVTEHIPEIIKIIKQIMECGYAYETKTGIYFDVSKFKNYGALSGQKMDEILAGSRKEVDETKDDPSDFTLWKKTDGELIEFDSPWGRGRPGWHIECSAMSLKYARGKGKTTMDIHGGARDLIFPDHENEIAQSEAATGKKFARLWMHTGFLTVDGEKMSKSLGNFITVETALNMFVPNALRMFFAMTHYRSPIDYNEDAIRAAGESAERLLTASGLMAESEKDAEKKNKKDSEFRKETDRLLKEFHEHMENDFDTPNALAALFNFVRITNSHCNQGEVDKIQLKKISKELTADISIFGIVERISEGIEDKKDALVEIAARYPEQEKEKLVSKTAEQLIELILEIRDNARKKKQFAVSDEIRKRLTSIGITLEDSAKGQKWKTT